MAALPTQVYQTVQHHIDKAAQNFTAKCSLFEAVSKVLEDSSPSYFRHKDYYSAEALYWLGELYSKGDPQLGIKIDTEKAYQCYSKAITAGPKSCRFVGIATFKVASAQEHGLGCEVQTNKFSLFNTYKKAADLGHLEAILKVAQAYQSGTAGVPKNLGQAREYYLRLQHIPLIDDKEVAYQLACLEEDPMQQRLFIEDEIRRGNKHPGILLEFYRLKLWGDRAEAEKILGEAIAAGYPAAIEEGLDTFSQDLRIKTLSKCKEMGIPGAETAYKMLGTTASLRISSDEETRQCKLVLTAFQKHKAEKEKEKPIARNGAGETYLEAYKREFDEDRGADFSLGNLLNIGSLFSDCFSYLRRPKPKAN